MIIDCHSFMSTITTSYHLYDYLKYLTSLCISRICESSIKSVSTTACLDYFFIPIFGKSCLCFNCMLSLTLLKQVACGKSAGHDE